MIFSVAIYILFYRFFLFLYHTGIRIASIKNKKAKLWLLGRQNWQAKLQMSVNLNCDANQPTVWMHCASLGEFEQGRPLLEQLKKDQPAYNFIVSFFSPSGYEVRKNYGAANVVCYLPKDDPHTAKCFLDIVQPKLVLWIKYEYWYFFLSEIKLRQVPLLLVSGIFRQNQPFFNWYGGLHRQMLQCFTALFVQNQLSAELATSIAGGEKVLIAGDTRFDRVIEIAENFQSIPKIEDWLQGAEQVMVCGSTWDEDEKELSHYIKLHPEIKFVIAPHNVNEEEITELRQLIPNAITYTELTEKTDLPASHVLIIDTIGLLSRLYSYAQVTFVGGGFGANGIHNVLEAAVYGRPVVHGPEYHKFAEAKDLIAAGGSFAVEQPMPLEKILDKLFQDKNFYEKACAAAKAYVYSKRGATKMIVNYIQEKRLLTNP